MARRLEREESTLRDQEGAARGGRVGEVLLVAGEGRLLAFPLDGDEVVIGRSSSCDVAVDHRAFSRRHAVLRPGAAPSVQDLGSTNGTWVASQLRRGGDPVPLVRGEGFHIGPFSLLVVPGRGEASSWTQSGVERLVVEDPSPDRVAPVVRDIAASGVNVLLLGETGVGKERLAETLHALSGRAGALIRINCAALSETLLESELFGHEKGAFTGAVAARSGLLEAASGGSVFLDEIGELPLGIQAKLLRAVETREILRLGSTRPIAIDVRFLAATNRDLPAEVEAGRFRRDLYFRLDGVTLRIPPLRERRGLVAPLALSFLAEAAQRLGREPVHAAPEPMAALERHDWPGNVRELRAVVERAVLLSRGREVGARHLVFAATPSDARPAGDRDPDFLSADQRDERARIVAALDECGGNQTRAARSLGMGRSAFVNKLALYRIPRPKSS